MNCLTICFLALDIVRWFEGEKLAMRNGAYGGS
jgi:hypothetical protein